MKDKDNSRPLTTPAEAREILKNQGIYMGKWNAIVRRKLIPEGHHSVAGLIKIAQGSEARDLLEVVCELMDKEK